MSGLAHYTGITALITGSLHAALVDGNAVGNNAIKKEGLSTLCNAAKTSCSEKGLEACILLRYCTYTSECHQAYIMKAWSVQEQLWMCSAIWMQLYATVCNYAVDQTCLRYHLLHDDSHALLAVTFRGQDLLGPVDNGGLRSALHWHRQDIITRQRLDACCC